MRRPSLLGTEKFQRMSRKERNRELTRLAYIDVEKWLVERGRDTRGSAGMSLGELTNTFGYIYGSSSVADALERYKFTLPSSFEQ